MDDLPRRDFSLSQAIDPPRRDDAVPPPIVTWSWQAESVSKLTVLVIGGILGLLVWRASNGSWPLTTVVVGLVLILLVVATHPAVLAALVQLRRDALAARVRLAEIRAEYRARQAEIAARERTQAESIRSHAQLREEADRKLIARAGERREAIALGDPLRDWIVTALVEAYQHHDKDGFVPAGIISRRKLVEAGFVESQYDLLKMWLEGAGVARYERGRWRLNVERFHDAEEATKAMLAWWKEYDRPPSWGRGARA